MPTSSSEFRDKIDRIIDAFEEDWLAGSRPRIESFLDTAGAARREVFIELAFLDMEYRLRGGEAQIIEDYLRRFPELNGDSEALHSLIAEEFRLRRRLNQNPSWEEYRRRFPNQTLHLDSHVAAVSDTVAARLPSRAPLSGVKLSASSQRYKPQRIVAEGGMGYIARIVDTEFDRPLAMKVLSPKLKDDPELVQRFLREARLTGQLQHPGIPPVQDKGKLEDGSPFFIMKLIKGESLAKLLRDRKSPVERLGYFVGAFASICQTMAYAHSRGIIHRDLKPANVMVGAFGEVQVMDWGLAKVLRTGLAKRDTGEDPANTIHILNKDTSVGRPTVAGVVMGTPGYMAPEQARGEIEKLDQRCDVFGLGGILCDILTGKPPFAASDAMNSQRRAMFGDIKDAFHRLDNSGGDPELIAIAKQCLAPELADRLPDAKAVADAVNAYQVQVEERLKQAELEQARLLTKADEEKKRRRDRRILGGCIAALLIAGVAGWLWNREKYQAAEGSVSRTAADAVTRQVDKAVDLVNFAGTRVEDENLTDARALLGHAKAVADDARTKASDPKISASDQGAIEAKFAGYAKRRSEVDADCRLAERLVEAFNARTEIVEDNFNVRRRATVALGKGGPAIYRKALADYGVPLESADAATLVARLKKFPCREESLGLALTDWMLLEPSSKTQKIIFDAAQVLDPDEWRCGFRVALRGGNGAELVKLSQKAAVGPKHSKQTVIVADALQVFERPQDAIAFLRRARAAAPGDFWANELFGLFLTQYPPDRLAPERSDEALNCFEAAYIVQPDPGFAVAGLAEAQMAALRYEQCELICRRYLETHDARNTRVRSILVDVLTRAGRFADAEKYAREGLKLDPGSGYLAAALARLRVSQGKPLDGRKIVQDSQGVHPGFVGRLVAQGYVALNLGDHDLAHDSGELLVKWNPRFSPGLDILSRANLERVNIPLAEKYAKEAIENEPKSNFAHATLGEVRLRQKLYAAGFESLKKSAECSVGPTPFLLDPAKGLAAQKYESEAGWLFAEIVRRDPQDAAAWQELLKTLRVTGEKAKARSHLGSAYAQLTPEQRQTFDLLPDSDSRPVNPLNRQQSPKQQPVRAPK
jgi:serine/threonine protein kinase